MKYSSPLLTIILSTVLMLSMGACGNNSKSTEEDGSHSEPDHDVATRNSADLSAAGTQTHDANHNLDGSEVDHDTVDQHSNSCDAKFPDNKSRRNDCWSNRIAAIAMASTQTDDKNKIKKLIENGEELKTDLQKAKAGKALIEQLDKLITAMTAKL